MAVLIFDETPGAGVYTAQIGVPRGAAVSNVFLVPLAAPWDATTVALDMGDTLTAADAYFAAYDFSGLSAYDPTAAVAKTNFTDLVGDGNNYSPATSDWPGVLYMAGDVLVAVVTTTGAGGSTGLLAVRIEGTGFSAAVHRAVKV